MKDLVVTLELDQVLRRHGVQFEGEDFEAIYAELHADPNRHELRHLIERRVSEYFGALESADEPNIYDLIVLSLREKDVIATFNWDPFLWMALERNHELAPPPHYLFLHGCAILGWCQEHRRQGPLGTECYCGRPFTPTRLLYPVTDKDYASDPYVEAQWMILKSVLKRAFVFTIFGYGAPESDAAAVELMSAAWGTPEERQFEQVEIIDIEEEKTLRSRWDRFIHTHHYTTTNDFFRSSLANAPRRTCEATWQRVMEGRFVDTNRVPTAEVLEDLWEWFAPLVEAEVAFVERNVPDEDE